MKERITNFLKAGYACLYAVSHEEERISGEITAAATAAKREVWSWNFKDGLVLSASDKQEKLGESIKETGDPLKMLAKFNEHSVKGGEPFGVHVRNKSIVILKDFHLFMKQSNPLLIRLMREAITVGRATQRHLIILGCQLHLLPELEKEVTVIEFQLPKRDELLIVAESILEGNKKKSPEDMDKVLDAGSGLTTSEFADATALALVSTGKPDPATIFQIKTETIKKGGILEVMNADVSFDDIGGMTDLKEWVSKRKNAFTKEARAYGLPSPKGVVLFGIQGGGKSFASKAIANELGCPLLRLDAGKLFGGIVGSSEANTRNVISQVEAFGTCALMIDEIDKGFAGMTGGHDGDSGTTRRVIGTFLTWMQEKKSNIFIIATANDLTKLPPELLRKGRWDELFFIDLPTTTERVEIWKVQIRRHGRKPEQFDLEKLAGMTEGFTGAEIQALFIEALYSAFEDGKEPTDDLIEELSASAIPLSKTMSEGVDTLRKWSEGRARPASQPEAKLAIVGRKIS